MGKRVAVTRERLDRYARRKHWRIMLQYACDAARTAQPGPELDEAKEQIAEYSVRVRYWFGDRATKVMNAVSRRYLVPAARG